MNPLEKDELKVFSEKKAEIQKMSAQVRTQWGQGEGEICREIGPGRVAVAMAQARETIRLDSKGLDMALPLSVAAPEAITPSAEEMLLSTSLPLSHISPHTMRKNSLVIDVCGFRRPSVLLVHVPNAWIQIFWEFLGSKGANPPWNGLGRVGPGLDQTHLLSSDTPVGIAKRSSGPVLVFIFLLDFY